MNERIRQLAELSKMPKTMMVDGVLQSVVTIDAERFAELIVRECADVTHRLIVEDGKEFPVKSVAYRLKEHFGVEE